MIIVSFVMYLTNSSPSIPVSISSRPSLSSPSLQCLPPHIFGSLHSIMSLTGCPSSPLITCPYHLSLVSVTFSAISTTSHLLIALFHNISDLLSFISSYYMSIPSHSLTFSAMSATSYLFLISSFFILSFGKTPSSHRISVLLTWFSAFYI